MAIPRSSRQNGRKSIHVFDLDDTLIQTAAMIRVRGEGGAEVRVLTPAEFTTFELKPGEVFDFKDFADVGILARGIVVKYTRDIISTLLRHGTQSDFGILTARGDKKLHAPFLIRLFQGLFGLRLRNSLIFNLSDERFQRHKEGMELPETFGGRKFSALSIPERKALVIAQDLVLKGYNDISLYDDSRENLQAFKVMRKAFPALVYKPHFIDPTWKVRLEEFRVSGLETKPLNRGAESARLIIENHSRYRGKTDAGMRDLEEVGRIDLDGGLLALRSDAGRFFLQHLRPANATPLQ
jgi:hypothetical protein